MQGREKPPNFLVQMSKRRQPKERKPRAPTPPAPEEMHGFPKRLRDCIEEQETSATAIAELAGVSTPVVTKAQNGEQWEGIGAGNVIRIAKALGVRPAWLLLGEEPKALGDIPAVAHGSVSLKELARLVADELEAKPPRSQVTNHEGPGPSNN